MAGDDGTFSVTFSGGTAPYTVAWNFGGGATPNTTSDSSSSPSTATVNLSNPAGGTFTATVTVTDGDGLSDTATVDYTYAEADNSAPVLTLTDNGDGTVTAAVTDADNNDVTITATPPAGINVAAATQTVTGGNGSATFSFSAADIFAGGSGDVSFTADDGAGGTDTETVTLTLGGITLAADTLYAIPMSTSAAAGDPVRILIATGALSNPFQFLNAVRVTAPAGFEYVDDSFNIGAIGGELDDADGIWTAVNPGSFLTAPDSFIVETTGLDADATGVAGRTGVDFNVTPLGGSDVTGASGALFNFEAIFSAGANLLSFQETQGVTRTYYTDSNTTPQHLWADLDNDNGAPNTVTAN
jgi:hypothetical protein